MNEKSPQLTAVDQQQSPEKTVELALAQEARALWSVWMREDWEAASESIVAKAEALKKTYGQKEVEAYRMWHALSGSGIRDEAEITHGDFPGEDSVLTFFKTRGKK